MSDNAWYDAEDYSPQLICEAELVSGQVTDAVFVCGQWETVDGEAIYPIRFRPKENRVVMPLYSARSMLGA